MKLGLPYEGGLSRDPISRIQVLTCLVYKIRGDPVCSSGTYGCRPETPLLPRAKMCDLGHFILPYGPQLTYLL